MRTPGQIYVKYSGFLHTPTKGEALNAIRLIQEDAYNQAIDDVDNLIENHDEEVYIGVVNDILKLKK
ncbi:hypothetical protein [Dysgonomonas macrotermitis]|uniref:Uncharacterized protein n=1 Tax=Dysgonomonas macrotermitis TaxID=1346286 RepID=A0A1M4UI13_9BACT|nr:hypothetical protein [Dysgonomonas macrotermitis]SHE56298.1 hypothetical protein SAMN05444362_101608 [Dysgonomonas macrotermitis]